MIIAGIFSFNDGQQIIQDHYSAELREIEEVIAAVNSSEHRNKVSKEKTMPMTIFHRLDLIDVGVEIVPIKSFADHMSTGVSYFEQFVWDLEHRGVSDLDIPVLILGIAASPDRQPQDKA
jgi:hypothetical protein